MVIRALFVFVSILFVLSTSSFAAEQSAKDALSALKKLEAKIETGMSYKDYVASLGDTNFYVKRFLESKEVGKEVKVANALKDAFSHYEIGRDVWDDEFTKKNSIIKGFIYEKSDLGQLLLKRYQGISLTTYGNDRYIFIKEALSIIWKEAANEIKKASTLMQESSASSDSEVDKLKKEIDILKQENERLKDELMKAKRKK